VLSGGEAHRNSVVPIEPGCFRPTEVHSLLGDPSKAKEKLGWQPEITFNELVLEMVANDLRNAAREVMTLRNGCELPASCEALM
jgi:GDPmannose 4,6-dehydratase